MLMPVVRLVRSHCSENGSVCVRLRLSSLMLVSSRIISRVVAVFPIMNNTAVNVLVYNS